MQWEYAIDAGSDKIRMTVNGQEEFYAEPSCAASSKARGTFAWGSRALAISEREPMGVIVERPVNGGIITDTRLMAKWTRLLTSEIDKRVMKRPGVLLSVSSGMRADMRDELERRVIDEGVPLVGLVPSDLACALGAGLPVLEPEASLIVDIGAGKMSASIISAGKIVKSDFLPFGMRLADERLISLLRTESAIGIGYATAKEVRHEIGALSGVSDDVKTQKAAFDYAVSLPRMREISASAVKKCVEEPIRALSEMLSRLILFTPEEISADLLTRGITLAGGGAVLFGLSAYMQKALSLPVKVADNPDMCTILGLRAILENQKAYSGLIEDEMEESRRP